LPDPALEHGRLARFDGAPGPPLALPAGCASVEFISDLHLCAALPRTFERWSRYLDETTADAVFMLGDLFEAWVGDDALGEQFEQACCQALRRASSNRQVCAMRGNRDFLLGNRFFAATGVLELSDPVTVEAWGSRAVLTHGDALCLADTDYQRFRSEVRGTAWQEAFLAQPLPERLRIAEELRQASRQHQQGRDPVTFADVDPTLAGRWLSDARATVLIHGHTHRPLSEMRTQGWTRHVLSDWDLDDLQTPRAEVLRWTQAGFERRTLGPA
jgi:UDP-2,3-diacylglucosamine hydrolase